LLIALGQDPDSDHLRETPRRVAGAYAELLTPEDFYLTTFANDEGYNELVLARDIPFQSLCEHHMLPFSGVALRLPRFDGQGRWLDQATFASASFPVAASNSLGVW
jgi:hypothetical protein